MHIYGDSIPDQAVSALSKMAAFQSCQEGVVPLYAIAYNQINPLVASVLTQRI